MIYYYAELTLIKKTEVKPPPYMKSMILSYSEKTTPLAILPLEF